MATPPLASPEFRSAPRVLIVGHNSPELGQILEHHLGATIIDEREFRALVRAGDQNSTPDIVICSGQYFHNLLRASRSSFYASDNKRLSIRQNEVLALVVRGFSNREVARVVGITERVVKREVGMLLMIFDVSNRTELAMVVSQGEPFF